MRQPVVEQLEARLLLAAQPMISEFLAVNANGLVDADGDTSDWLEVHNPTAAAVDLTGWKLADRNDVWSFPATTVLPAGGYLVVFASGKDRRLAGQELHTSFRLDGDGEYLALLDAADNVVHAYAPEFPEQDSDLSYGLLYEQHGTTALVEKGDAARYMVPTAGPLDPAWRQAAFDDAAWADGATGLGFGLGGAGGPVTLIPQGALWRYLDDGSNQGTAWHQPGFNDSSWSAGPAQLGYGEGDEATVVDYGGNSSNKYITTYFRRTFQVTNAWQVSGLTLSLLRDDGAVMYLNGQELPRSNMPAGAIDYQTRASSGVGGGDESTFYQYTIDPALLVEGDNVLAVEIHQNAPNSTDASFDLRLVGDTSTADLVETDLEAAMRGANASVLLRVPFHVNDPAEFTELYLEMAYEDGYVAYLNGVEVSRRNAPASPAWDSSATADRAIQDALSFEAVDLTAYLGLLTPGENVLAVHAMNDAAGDGQFVACPRLYALAGAGWVEQYFTTPTPGAANIPGVLGVVADTSFSVDRGFFDAPFQLEIATATDGAEIRYTLDGSEPTATTGAVYTGPIAITGTSVVRAAAFKAGWLPSDVDTQTYLFLGDVIAQSPAGQAPGAGWPTGSVNGQTIDYGMDPNVVNDARYSGLIEDALLAIPTISLVTELGNLFDGSTGIYTHAGSRGQAWERPTSVELINPDGTEGFQADAGIRIRGGYSRSGGNPKHAFRLFFRDEYGDAKLEYPLFGDEGADEFDNIDLRTAQNYSWSFGGDGANTFLRDVFSRDMQREMGQPYTRSRYYHLYINGVYWGLYMTQERAEAGYAASYFGGEAEDYDVIKATGNDAGYRIEATDGTFDAWTRLVDACRAGVTSNAAYYAIQGMNAGGAPSPAYERLLDVDNLIDYMISTFYVGDRDAPVSSFLGNDQANNFFAIYNRVEPDGFKFFRHDAEHTLDRGDNDRTGPWPAGDVNVGGWDKFWYTNPQWMHQQLVANAEYRLRFADRVQKHLFNDGVLTPERAVALLNERAAQIDSAIIAESARWGDAKREPAHTRDDSWLPTVNGIRNNYLPGRTATVLNQFRSKGWYPNVTAPSFRINGAGQHGGRIAPGDSLSITAPAGTIYYTLDGSDPRSVGGAVSPTAVAYTGAVPLGSSTVVKARVYTGGQWSALDEAAYYPDVEQSLRITEIMYHPAPPTQAEIDAGFLTADDFEFVELTNIGTQPVPLMDAAFTRGINRTLPDVSVPAGGRVVVVSNAAAFEARYGAGAATIVGTYTGTLSDAGERILLVGPLGEVIHDFKYADGWFDHTDSGGFSLTVRDPAQDRALWAGKEGWRPSDAPGGTPGGTDAAVNPGSILINEVLAHTDAASGDWIELHNTTAAAIDVGGWFLSDSRLDLAKVQIPAGTTVPGGEYVVLTEVEHFGPLAAAGGFALSEFGDEVYLTSNAGGQPGGYREEVDFGASPNGQPFGRYVKSTGTRDFTLLAAPTPGGPNQPPAIFDVVINEIMYHPDDPAQPSPYDDDDFEFLELLNTSAQPRTLSDLYLGGGVGFTFGWYDADSLGAAVRTLQAGATATWQADLPAAGDWQVLVWWDVLDGEGNVRTLDSAARYAVSHAGGTAVVQRDQNREDTTPAWVSLGTWSFDAGPASVTLGRGTDDSEEWTLADRVKFVRGGTEVLVDDDDAGFSTTGSDVTTIGPGEYVLIVRDLAAFASRYDTTGLTIAGQYSGRLSNAGDSVRLYVATTPEVTGYIPYVRVDHVNYEDAGDWPAEPDGTGASLARIGAAAYGNDVGNWSTGRSGGTPGAQNVYLDTTPPTTPTGLTAGVTVWPRIDLSWTPAADPQSGVDHYVVFRNGVQVGTTAAAAFSDANPPMAGANSYQVVAVNRDGYTGGFSTPAEIAVPGIESYHAPDDRTIVLAFTEPLTVASATAAGNYTCTNANVLAAALDPDGRTVRLTTSVLLPGQGYTVTVGSVQTVSGNALPAGLQKTFVYAPTGSGTILLEYWTGIGGTAVTNLTGNPNYPDNPTGSREPTSFEAPTDWANDYGTRMRGYVYPPTTGNYVFWIASDDGSQLFLSTDEDPAHKVPIASVGGWTNSREWTRTASQQSAPIHLEAGRRYYIEALHKEGGGGDNLAVRWQLPDGSWENGDANQPIPGQRLSPYNPDITAPAVAVDPLTTSDTTPPLSGTVNDPQATVTVTVGGRNYAAVNRGDGTWALADNVLSPPLTDGTYDVVVAARDPAGNTGYDTTTGELSIVAPGPEVTIDPLSTGDPTPELTGTVEDPQATIAVEVNGRVYAATNRGDGTWVLPDGTISPPLNDGTYDVIVRATDTSGAVGRDTTTHELTVAVPPPAVTIDPLVTDDPTPELTGEVDDPQAAVRIVVAGRSYTATNRGDGTWVLADGTINPPIADGTYNVIVLATSVLGRTGRDDTLDELTVDTAAPLVSVRLLVTNDTTPSVRGNVDDPAATVTVTIDGRECPATNLGTGTWVLADDAIAPPLADGTYDVQVAATDALGHVGLDATTGELRVDTVPPVVTVAPLRTPEGSPELTGTVDDPLAVVSLWLVGKGYTAVNRGDGSWALPAGTINSALLGGIYDVQAAATDDAGNTGHDATADELEINGPPSADGLIIETDEGVAVAGLAVAHDADALTYRLYRAPGHGNVDFRPDGSFDYTPAGDFNGTDSFEFVANDGQTDSDPATVEIVVHPINDRPVASGRALTVGEDRTLVIVLADLTASDAETPRAGLTFTPGQPEHGSVTWLDAGRWQYRPAENFQGADSFPFTVTDRGDPDGSGAGAGALTSDPAVLSITVTPVNDVPVAGSLTLTIRPDGPTEIVLPASDAETPRDQLTFLLATPSWGTLTRVGPGRYEYEPDPAHNGDVTFTYSVMDTGDPAGSYANPGATESARATVRLKPGFQVPFDAKTPASWQDENGEWVTVRLSGPGAGTVYLAQAGGCDASRIILAGTTDQSAVTIATAGAGSETVVGDVIVHGSLRSLTARSTDLGGDLTVDGLLGSLTLDDVVGGRTIALNANEGDVGPRDKISITLDSVKDSHLETNGVPINTLTVTEWLDGDDLDDAAGTIAAPWVNKLNVKGSRKKGDESDGNFAASLALSGDGIAAGKYVLNSATIAGAITGGTWTVGGVGNVNTIRATNGMAAGWALDAAGFVKTLDASKGDLAGTVEALYFNRINTKGDLTAAITATGEDERKHTGVGALTAGRVNGALLTCDVGGVGSVTVIDWTGGGKIDAEWIGKITTKGDKRNGIDGDWTADLDLGGANAPRGVTLGNVSVKGQIACTWDVTGQAGMIRADSTAGSWTLTATEKVQGIDAKNGLAGTLTGLYFDKLSTKADLTASIAATGLDAKKLTSIGALTAGSVKDVSLTGLPGGIGTITVVQWVDGDSDGDAGTIEAGWVGRITTKGDKRNGIDGDFDAILDLAGANLPARKPTLGNTTVAGNVTGSTWTVRGDGQAVNVKGDVDGWTLDVQAKDEQKGALKSLSAKMVGTASVTVADALGTCKAVCWENGSLDVNELKTLQMTGDRRNDVDGDFGAALTVRGAGLTDRQKALNVANIAGSVHDETWSLGWHVGTLTLGSLINAEVLVGCAAATGDANDFGDNKFTVGGVTLKGCEDKYFENSTFAAYSIGSMRFSGKDAPASGTVQYGILKRAIAGFLSVGAGLTEQPV
ncbi:MAG TPA: lamin tail domain-containing protein [Phycisphaerae bacterium]|nr:lamin tail domain-containing protein [Phycisphaerae bacterium]